MAKHCTPSGSGTATRSSFGAPEAVAMPPILVEQAAEAQVGDAGAADLAEAGERDRVGAGVQDDVHPVAAALQRDAMVRRAEEDHLAKPPGPLVPRRVAVVPCAARYQPAHAVADDVQVDHGHLPRLHQLLDQPGERPSVGGDVEPAVVVEVYGRERRGEGGIVGQRRSVVVAIAAPLQVAAAQPVHEQEDVAVGPRDGLGEGLPVSSSGCPSRRNRMGIASGFAVAARWSPSTPFSAAMQRLAHGRGRLLVQERSEPPENDIDPAPDEARHSADAAVDQARDAGGLLHGPARNARDAGNVPVHGLDHAGQANDAVDGEAAVAVKIRAANVLELCVSWRLRRRIRPPTLAQERANELAEINRPSRRWRFVAGIGR